MVVNLKSANGYRFMVEELGKTRSKNIFIFTWGEGKEWKAELLMKLSIH